MLSKPSAGWLVPSLLQSLCQRLPTSPAACPRTQASLWQLTLSSHQQILIKTEAANLKEQRQTALWRQHSRSSSAAEHLFAFSSAQLLLEPLTSNKNLVPMHPWRGFSKNSNSADGTGRPEIVLATRIPGCPPTLRARRTWQCFQTQLYLETPHQSLYCSLSIKSELLFLSADAGVQCRLHLTRNRISRTARL